MPIITPECKKDLEELKSFKYLLGDFGIQMLIAVARGAQTGDAIMMLSGVPAACISGRMPVLLNLKLIEQQNNGEFLITQKGRDFLQCINECI
jgi:predicted transcriptional regulator